MVINQIEIELIEEESRKNLYDDLYAILTDHEIALFAKKYPIPCIRPKVIEYLVDNFSKDEIDRILTELYEQEEKEIRKTEESKKQEQKEAEENEKRLKQQKKEKIRKDKFREEIKQRITNDEINLFLMKHHFNTVNETINYLVETFNSIRQIRTEALSLKRVAEIRFKNEKRNRQVEIKKQEKAHAKFMQEESDKEKSIKLNYNNIQYLGFGRYKYDYKTADGKNTSITLIANSIEELKLKVQQMNIPWEP